MTDEFSPVCELDPDGTIAPEQLSEVRRFASLEIDWASHPGDPAALRTVAALAASGVPLASIGSSPSWAEDLGPGLLELIDGVEVGAFDDPLLRELHSLRTRRQALTSKAEALQRKSPSVSVMICTCRPENVGHALRSAELQRYPDLEIVLVLHGCDAADPRIRAALRGAKLPVSVVEVDADTVFGDALNAGIAAASGEYVTKMDDDDWYGPNYVGDLMLAAWYSGAEIVGNFTEFVHLEELDTTIHRPAGGGEKYSTFVSGGTITFSQETIRELGGFPSLPRAIDVGLCERAKDAELSIYRNHGMEFLCSRREQGHTWDVQVGYFLKSAERQWYKKPFSEHLLADSLEQCLTR